MSLVELTREESVALVRLNRPPVNALNEELAGDLQSAFEECRSSDIRAVVVTGQPNFAAGADIKRFKEQLDEGEETDATAAALVDAIAVLESLEKPTIAAVHGFALGGGLELAMGADFRYLADDARVGQPEILLGLIPGAGGTQRLTRLIGYQRAKKLIFSGRHVPAGEALEIGLADQVASADDILELAMRDAAEFSSMATLAIARAKKVLNETGASREFGADMAKEAAAFQRLFGTEDSREGVAAFIEKRDADFKGE
ncbi:MAG: enoyl-CoA hydratase/isomerase family protein [Actinobacteria bacterium]|nr:MAG: enoyl-CoA hydratase/isomerase family protein [Actinomycetota bacterium]